MSETARSVKTRYLVLPIGNAVSSGRVYSSYPVKGLNHIDQKSLKIQIYENDSEPGSKGSAVNASHAVASCAN